MQPCVTGYRRFATTHGLWFVRGLPIGYPPIEDTAAQRDEGAAMREGQVIGKDNVAMSNRRARGI